MKEPLRNNCSSQRKKVIKNRWCFLQWQRFFHTSEFDSDSYECIKLLWDVTIFGKLPYVDPWFTVLTSFVEFQTDH